MLDCLKEQCEIVIPNVSALTKEEFTMSRRGGLGASDAAVYLGVNPYYDATSLIKNKTAMEITIEEIEVGKKPTVRKGADLEPFILQKFAEITGMGPLEKPGDTYRLKQHPHLWINYDGLLPGGIPVEAKFISQWGRKYWNFDKAVTKDNVFGMGASIPAMVPPWSNDLNIAATHCRNAAAKYGIPDYYYPQIQQQLMGTKQPFGYIAALDDKYWELRIFLIPADEWLQKQITIKSLPVYEKILSIKGVT